MSDVPSKGARSGEGAAGAVGAPPPSRLTGGLRVGLHNISKKYCHRDNKAYDNHIA